MPSLRQSPLPNSLGAWAPWFALQATCRPLALHGEYRCCQSTFQPRTDRNGSKIALLFPEIRNRTSLYWELQIPFGPKAANGIHCREVEDAVSISDNKMGTASIFTAKVFR